MTTADEPEEHMGERLPPGELRPDERGQDRYARISMKHGMRQPRPLTREESEARGTRSRSAEIGGRASLRTGIEATICQPTQA
jgi:hypothetical protein